MQSASAANTCAVSVIICTYNRAQSLHSTLVSLDKMAVPADFAWEVVVVDNNSTDDTRGATARFSGNARIPVRYIFEGRQGLNHARNAGVKEAEGNLLFFIDDDVEVSDNWLLEMKKAFDVYPVIGVGGRVLLKEDLQRPAWWNSEYDGALGKFDSGNTNILSDASHNSIIGIGANLGFRRSVFNEYGGFHPHLDRRGSKLMMGGDIEYTERLKAAGGLLMYYPSAVVFQCPDPSRFTKSYLRRWHFRIGEWEARRARPRIRKPSSIFTLPLWKYGQLLRQLLQTASLTLSGRHDERFYHELQCISQLGYFFGAAKNGVTWHPFSSEG